VALALLYLKLLGLAASLLPMAAALWALWRHRWRQAPISETVLGASLCVPVALLVEIVVLGFVPYGRPLDYLPVAHIIVDVACVAIAWRYRSALRAGLRGILDSWRTGWREAWWAQRVSLLLGIAVLALATAYGAWAVPWAWDELSYHLPQALQPYQDGRLGPVQANLIWADSYPRGVELLYFWTMAFLHTDAGFHPVNAAFGFLLVLATYVAARRVGLGTGWAWLAAGVVPTAPIFSHLATIGYIDLSVGGALAVALAAALPERDGRWGWGSCLVCMGALILGLWMKATVVCLAGIILVYLMIASFAARIAAWRRGGGSLGRPGPTRMIATALVTVALGSIPYLLAWHKYGTPTYPMCVRVAGRVIFDGPMTASALSDASDLPIAERYAVYWTRWFDPVTPDSPGSFGPLFTLGMVPAALVCLVAQLRRIEHAWLLLAASFWLVLAMPSYHLTRYALYILLPGALCAMRVGKLLGSRQWQASWCGAILLLTLANVGLFGRCMFRAVQWYRSCGLSLLSEDRNRPLRNRLVRQAEYTPHPDTRDALYGLMNRGETLVTAVHGFQGLFYDPAYSYRVEHRPARAWPYAHHHPRDRQFGCEHAAEWLAGLQSDGVAAVMVYKDSAEDQALRAEKSGYELAYAQPENQGDPVVLIYRRQEAL
jgi:hypothetical protein